MKQAFFVTGTDTSVGKTYVACKLIQQFISQGYKVVGMKPVAAGGDFVDGERVNEDVLKLEAVSNVKASRALINPYSLSEPIAPHIAAEKSGVEIEIEVIQQAFNQLAKMADIVIVEGAGGFLVPLSEHKTMADLAAALNIPIILVVGMKLGCINHTLLTVEAIKARQLKLHGWVANQLSSDMVALEENIAAITQNIHMNYLENYPYK